MLVLLVDIKLVDIKARSKECKLKSIRYDAWNCFAEYKKKIADLKQQW
jgi:hypothetical protein